MTRLARDRDTHLTPEEIATEALRQFDSGAEPSIRSLAAALKVGPTAIYHHYPSRAAIVQAAADLVWTEVPLGTAERIGNPFEADPAEVLFVAAVVTRDVFRRHHRVAPHMAAVPQPNEMRTTMLGVVGNVMERLGLYGEEAAAAWHAWGSYVVGASLFLALRITADDEMGDDPGNPLRRRFHTMHEPAVIALSSIETLHALDDVADMSIWDAKRDDELFEQSVRRIIATFKPA
jgi:AcrR family transcriptional regulator